MCVLQGVNDTFHKIDMMIPMFKTYSSGVTPLKPVNPQLSPIDINIQQSNGCFIIHISIQAYLLRFMYISFFNKQNTETLADRETHQLVDFHSSLWHPVSVQTWAPVKIHRVCYHNISPKTKHYDFLISD